ncbi:MAG: cbb3-type cytochrome oxidase assembly protein CcoS [bacterium]|jgi:cbb3-type cytochrome oxidase maturation protein|nr:cbb3-type cytochrome oxidase assembly protein CcoS [Rhodocyclaceae bacterium]
MDILYLLVPLSVVLAIAIGAAFWWAVRNDQFEDMEGPAQRLLLDDDDRVAAPESGRTAPPDAEAAPPASPPASRR